MLHKPEFDCSKLGDFYDCGCEDRDDETEDSSSKAGNPNESAEPANTAAKDENLVVEISKEP